MIQTTQVTEPMGSSNRDQKLADVCAELACWDCAYDHSDIEDSGNLKWFKRTHIENNVGNILDKAYVLSCARSRQVWSPAYHLRRILAGGSR